MKKKIMTITLCLALPLFLNGCFSEMTDTQKGAAVGGAVGAIGGQIIGGSTGATLIGAGAGALGGALLNDAMNKDK